MAGSFNKVILVGRLTRDPEAKVTASGTTISKFCLAVDRQFSKEKATDFINITAWGKLADICNKYLSKGKQALVEGELQVKSYEDKEGQKRTAFEVVARTMQMLGNKGNNENPPVSETVQVVQEVEVDEFTGEDMPF